MKASRESLKYSPGSARGVPKTSLAGEQPPLQCSSMLQGAQHYFSDTLFFEVLGSTGSLYCFSVMAITFKNCFNTTNGKAEFKLELFLFFNKFSHYTGDSIFRTLQNNANSLWQHPFFSMTSISLSS